MTIEFDVTDNSHDLAALPAVSVASRSAVYVSGTLDTSDGLVHRFVYSFVPDGSPDIEGIVPVVATAYARPVSRLSCFVVSQSSIDDILEAQ